MDRKRKMDDQDSPPSSPPSSPRHHISDDENDTVSTTLSLSNHPTPTVRPQQHLPPPPPPPPPSEIHPSLLPPPQPPFPTQFHPTIYYPPNITFPYFHPTATTTPPPAAAVESHTSAGVPRLRRARRNPTRTPPEGRSPTIPPPYPWATTARATVHSLNHLLANKITAVSGDVQCRRCERQYRIEFDLCEKFDELAAYISANKGAMHHRAPKAWLNPRHPTCQFCQQENSARPIIADKKRSINWLFLLLGQMLGCCTLEQLKYFCKHTKNHRTGAKDRVLYLAYLALCKQLDPRGPFDI